MRNVVEEEYIPVVEEIPRRIRESVRLISNRYGEKKKCISKPGKQAKSEEENYQKAVDRFGGESAAIIPIKWKINYVKPKRLFSANVDCKDSGEIPKQETGSKFPVSIDISASVHGSKGPSR